MRSSGCRSRTRRRRCSPPLREGAVALVSLRPSRAMMSARVGEAQRKAAGDAARRPKTRGALSLSRQRPTSLPEAVEYSRLGATAPAPGSMLSLSAPLSAARWRPRGTARPPPRRRLRGARPCRVSSRRRCSDGRDQFAVGLSRGWRARPPQHGARGPPRRRRRAPSASTLVEGRRAHAGSRRRKRDARADDGRPHARAVSPGARGRERQVRSRSVERVRSPSRARARETESYARARRRRDRPVAFVDDSASFSSGASHSRRRASRGVVAGLLRARHSVCRLSAPRQQVRAREPRGPAVARALAALPPRLAAAPRARAPGCGAARPPMRGATARARSRRRQATLAPSRSRGVCRRAYNQSSYMGSAADRPPFSASVGRSS